MIVGPFQRMPLVDGSTADLFLLRFDAQGCLLSPRSAEILLNEIPHASDLFVFAHGWNNDFATALARYRGFIEGYAEQRRLCGTRAASDYRPILVGIIWPSTNYVLPREMGPTISGSPDPGGGARTQTDAELLPFVSESLDRRSGKRLSELIADHPVLDADEASRAAELLLNALWVTADPEAGAEPPKAPEFLRSWARLDGQNSAPPSDPDDFGTVQPSPSPVDIDLAGDSRFDPRNLLRAATAWKMKSRAGVVGAEGVGPLVQDILRLSSARLHTIGHSFGARVMLSALSSCSTQRPAYSMLLLQPAVNRWCFAQDVAGTHRAGGYRSVLERVEKPVLATFSSHDAPLTRFFHLAFRGGHLGEPATAAIGDPELYGALGGFGPAGLAGLSSTQPAAAPGEEGYRFDGGHRVIAVDGGAHIEGRPAISGHGDISNPTTWWALHCLAGPTEFV